MNYLLEHLCIVPGLIGNYLRKRFQEDGHTVSVLTREPQRSNDIECVRFSKWLSNTVSETDFVFLKMDIESLEFDNESFDHMNCSFGLFFVF